MPTTIDASPALPYAWEMLKNLISGNQLEDYQKKVDAGDYTPIETSAFVDPAKTAAYNEKLQSIASQNRLSSLLKDYNDSRTTPEQRTEMERDPAFWAGASNAPGMDDGSFSGGGKASFMPVAQKFSDTVQTQKDVSGLLDSYKKGGDVDPTTVGRFVASNPKADDIIKSLSTMGETYRDNNQRGALSDLIKKGVGGRELFAQAVLGRGDAGVKTAEQIQKLLEGEDAQATINAVGAMQQDPEWAKLPPNIQIAKIMQATNIKDPAKIKTILESANILKTLHTVKQGVEGNPNLEQNIMVDSTGQTVRKNAPWNPAAGATKVSLSVNNEGEKSFQKKLGEGNATLITKSQEEAAALQQPKQLLLELQKMNKLYKTGKQAEAMAAIDSALDYVGLSNKKQLSWAQKYQALTETATLQMGQNALKGSQTEREWEMVRKTQSGLGKTPEANDYLTAQSLNVISAAEDRARRASEAAVSNPYAPDMGMRIAVPPAATKPKTASDYMKKWR